MTHEQKPESAEFRTLETQVSECARDLHASLIALEEKLYVEFAEAEARGAAEQRRKDAEGAYGDWLPIETAPKDGTTILVPVKHIGADVVLWDLNGWRETTNMLLMRDPPTHWMPLPSFPSEYRPTNVAALEARVKELEEENERLKKPEWVCDEETSYADVYDALSQRDDPILGITKFTACRSVRDIWAFLDEKFVVHEFATGIEAKNAAAAIREGGEHG